MYQLVGSSSCGVMEVCGSTFAHSAQFGATVLASRRLLWGEWLITIGGLDRSTHRKHNGPGWNLFEAEVVVLWRFVVAVLQRGARFGATVWRVQDAGAMYALRQ